MAERYDPMDRSSSLTVVVRTFPPSLCYGEARRSASAEAPGQRQRQAWKACITGCRG